jgi:MraZ protein
MRFLGNIEAKMDAKCRVTIPAPFRRILLAEGQQMLFLRKDLYQACVVIYPEQVWESVLTELRARLNKWIPEEQDLYRQFMLEAEAVEMDASGRILISKAMLQRVGIESDVRFLGVDDTLELWQKSNLEQPRMSADVFCNRMQQLMGADKQQ